MVSTAVWMAVPVSNTVKLGREAGSGRKIINMDLDNLKFRFLRHLKLQQNLVYRQ